MSSKKSHTRYLVTISVNRGTSSITQWVPKKVYSRLKGQGLILALHGQMDSRWVKR